MTILGIIAEYNPFHDGHQYQLFEAKKQVDAEVVIAAMSGAFTQRGEPTIFDKWIRTEMALTGGVDLTLELPTMFATRSAQDFALGGVLTLAHAGVTHLAFGAENASLKELSLIANFLLHSPNDYRLLLKSHLKTGLSFPKAQSLALETLLPESTSILQQPNNLLAIQYLQIIKKFRLSIEPIVIQRQGDSHNTNIATAPITSATAIRRMILNGDDEWRHYVPGTSANIIGRCLDQQILPVCWNDFTDALLTLLRRCTPQDFLIFPDVSEGLENRLWQAAQNAQTIESLCHAIKSKRYTYTRIQRLLCHILLNLTATDVSNAEISYLRVLGFNPIGRRYLKTLQASASVPIITKTAAIKQLSPTARSLFEADCRATDIYYLAYKDHPLNKGRQDFYKGPVIQF